ncbi:hypothetical protein B0T21DRAFT_409140 [Apiosordaria backusii]|uniref:RING-type domain-containing protein n=1 Tax=Apiosordaria backusii TaxID=314023 RepID=A0AA40EN06_9PEZI|nr:hypothetical protein B0T21DRAFT_409140 [Apiosordaria backusii]
MASKNRESITLYSQLKPFLTSPLTTLILPPLVPCTLCLSDSEILTPLTPRSLRPTALEGVVLFCGHITCKPCFQLWHDTVRPKATYPPETYHPTHPTQPPSVPCPVCRRPLDFSDAGFCRHVLFAAPLIPPSGVPLTLNEGGEIPTHCSDCRVWRGRKLGELIAACRARGVTTAEGLEGEVRREERVKFLEEEIALVFPWVVQEEQGREDPVGFVEGEVRNEMEGEEPTWAGPSEEATGREFGERRGFMSYSDSVSIIDYRMLCAYFVGLYHSFMFNLHAPYF